MLLSRLRGSLVAAVIGDCIGEGFEGAAYVHMRSVLHTVEEVEKKWSDANKQAERGKKSRVKPEFFFTDDTAMARSIAASLVAHKSVNIKDIAARFGSEFNREPGRGYGGNVITVLKRLADPNLGDIFQPAREQFDGNGSYGNGGAMRISPLGLFFHKRPLEDLKEHTVEITRLTHSHPHAIVGALLQSFAVHLALSMSNTKPFDPAVFLQQLQQRLKPVEDEVYRHHRQTRRHADAEGDDDDDDGSEKSEKLPYCEKLELMKEFLGRDVSVKEVTDKLGNYISALGSVPTAVYCFLRGASKSVPDCQGRSEVEQTILYAILLGGDTDTIATMAAAIAGAYFGLEAVPQAWQEYCEGVTDALVYADKMMDLFTATERA